MIAEKLSGWSLKLALSKSFSSAQDPDFSQSGKMDYCRDSSVAISIMVGTGHTLSLHKILFTKSPSTKLTA